MKEDTLESIAEIFACKVKELINTNPNSTFKPGSYLHIPPSKGSIFRETCDRLIQMSPDTIIFSGLLIITETHIVFNPKISLQDSESTSSEHDLFLFKSKNKLLTTSIEPAPPDMYDIEEFVIVKESETQMLILEFSDIIVNLILTNNQMEQIHGKLTGSEYSTFFIIPNLNILSSKQCIRLQMELPTRFMMKKWNLLFKASEHGYSLRTIYNKIGSNPSILIIKNKKKEIFGAFSSQGFLIKPKHYGNGLTFLFTFKNPEKPKFFHWTGSDTAFIKCQKEFISFGGGETFGLYLNSDLEYGSSGKSQTFNNSNLSSTEEFLIIDIDIYTLTN